MPAPPKSTFPHCFGRPLAAGHIILLLLSSISAPSAVFSSGNSAAVSLFDGESLAGWRGVNGDTANWAAADGVLSWNGGPGARWIATDAAFSDFVLALEFNYEPGANSGVFFRTPAATGRPAYEGNEIQIVDESAPSFAGRMTEDRRMGALYTVLPPQKRAAAPPGKWHRLTIRCVGHRLEITLNGITILDTRLDAFPEAVVKEHPGLLRESGHIGLQSKPDSRIRFRNINVTPLASDTSPSP